MAKISGYLLFLLCGFSTNQVVYGAVSPSLLDNSISKLHHRSGKSLSSFNELSKNDLISRESMKDDAMDQLLPLDNRGGELISSGLLERLKIGSYFALWYALNVAYNIVNKKVLNVLPAPITVGTIQFFIGSLYCAILWTTKLRPKPVLSEGSSKQAVQKIGFYHSTGQLLSMISLGAGPVSFTHIVKALEPLFSAMVSIIVFKKVMAWQVYASLLPVVGGVGYACLKELSFSWLSFYSAMGSNLAFALRAVSSKQAMNLGSSLGSNLSSANLFGLVTVFASFMSIPAVLLTDGKSFPQLFKDALSTGLSQKDLIQAIILSGLFHYLNNEVMYLALSNVHPVTLAVGNTMKRVFIMVASIIVFRNPISVQAAIGSVVGISGVLVYSLTKQHFEKLEASQSK